MITKSMSLNTKQDAVVWASQLGLSNVEQEVRVADYIWDKKPFIGCTYEEHPISALSDDQFWKIAD